MRPRGPETHYASTFVTPLIRAERCTSEVSRNRRFERVVMDMARVHPSGSEVRKIWHNTRCQSRVETTQ